MSQNPRQHHSPVKFSTEKFEHYTGGEDPAALHLAAHQSAQALISRGRQNTDPGVTQRLVAFTDVFGLETLARIWKHSPAVSLPGALWRMYSLRDTARLRAKQISHYYRRGMESNWTARVISGVADPPTGTEIIHTVDRILTGAYTGEFDIALERFAAFCRIIAAGQEITARDIEPGTYSARTGKNNPRGDSPSAEVRAEAGRRARSLRDGATKLRGTAVELETAAAKWRLGSLS